MIDPRVFEAASDFRKRFADLSKQLPVYALDGSWLSLNIVDAATFHVRGKRDFSEQEKQLVHEASAYLGIMLSESWNRFGVTSKVEITEYGVMLSALEGPEIPQDDSHVIPIGAAYSTLLSDAPREMPIIADFKRPVGAMTNITRLFSFGVATGLSPFGDGPWKIQTTDRFGPQIDEVKRGLAQQLATSYKRIFPDEKLGQVAELYLGKALFPPMLMVEPMPAVEAANELYSYFNEYGITKDVQIGVLQNLGLLAVEPLSEAALVLRAALSEGYPSLEFMAVYGAREAHVNLLRNTLQVAERLIGIERDWIDCQEDWETRYEREKRLGFLPLLTLDIETLGRRHKEDKLAKLVLALVVQDIGTAQKLLAKLVSKTPGDVELRSKLVS